jgi:hypothetical protein
MIHEFPIVFLCFLFFLSLIKRIGVIVRLGIDGITVEYNESVPAASLFCPL